MRMGEGAKRLYVGNLYPEVTQDELRDRFKRFGEVNDVEIKHKTDIDGRPIQTFGFVNISMSDANLNQCINTLGNTKWKGYMMRIQQAKESFMSRLARERSEKENAPAEAKKLETGNNRLSSVKSKDQKTPDSGRRERTNPVARHQDNDVNYDPLSLAKSRLDESSGHEKKIVARHLGGERNEDDRNSSRSGNFTKLGFRQRSNELGEDPLKSEDFIPRQKSSYDPLKMIKKHTGQEDGGNAIDEGTVDNGVVIFGDEEPTNTGQKRKAYHSSDEDEDTTSAKAKPVENKKKQKKSTEEKLKEKEKLRERFQQRLTEKQKAEEEAKQVTSKKKTEPSGRFYAASSDEEENNEDTPSGREKVEQPEPSSQNILKKFQSFSSSVWADTDDESEGEKETEDAVDPDQEDHGEDLQQNEDDFQGERDRNYDILSQVIGKKVEKVVVKEQKREVKNYMPRFDPDAMEDDTKVENEENADESSPVPAGNTDNKAYEVTKNLKQAFSGGGRFSFGFGRSAESSQSLREADAKTSRQDKLFHLDPDDVKEKPAAADFSETFGSQLEGKRDFNAEMFFFHSDDDRIKEGIKFFFTDRDDLEKVRSEYDKKRPELAAIFKKKARSKAQLLRQNHKAKPMERLKGRRRRQKKRENFKK